MFSRQASPYRGRVRSKEPSGEMASGDLTQFHGYLRKTVTAVSYGMLAGVGFTGSFIFLLGGMPLTASTAMVAGALFATVAFSKIDEVRRYMRNSEIIIGSQAMSLDIQRGEIERYRDLESRRVVHRAGGRPGEGGGDSGASAPSPTLNVVSGPWRE
jgi:hypothetical protein